MKGKILPNKYSQKDYKTKLTTFPILIDDLK